MRGEPCQAQADAAAGAGDDGNFLFGAHGKRPFGLRRWWNAGQLDRGAPISAKVCFAGTEAHIRYSSDTLPVRDSMRDQAPASASLRKPQEIGRAYAFATRTT